MSAVPPFPAQPPAAPVDTLEARWIVPGPLEAEVRGWFARFPAATEARDDIYLLWPRLPGLAVKLRNGRTLEVKSYLGSSGVLDLPYGGQGRLEWWRKSSFPFDAESQDAVSQPGAKPAGWITVRKKRRSSWFPLPPASQDRSVVRRGKETGCMAELTEADVASEHWWTVGLEATGPAESLRPAVQHAVTSLFAQPLPAWTELDLDSSRSYAEWLLLRTDVALKAAD
jgi:hypothetical protein